MLKHMARYVGAPLDIKIGQNEVFKSVSILLPPTEVASIPLVVDGWNLTVEVSVISDGSGEPSIDLQGAGPNLAKLILKNWENPLGTAMNAPSELGITGLHRIQVLFLMAHWKVGNLNKIEIQFLKRSAT